MKWSFIGFGELSQIRIDPPPTFVIAVQHRTTVLLNGNPEHLTRAVTFQRDSDLRKVPLLLCFRSDTHRLGDRQASQASKRSHNLLKAECVQRSYKKIPPVYAEVAEPALQFPDTLIAVRNAGDPARRVDIMGENTRQLHCQGLCLSATQLGRA